ncbi:MAG: type II 3-dehydroquinate dehydratase [Rhizomicrobium sp.]
MVRSRVRSGSYPIYVLNGPNLNLLGRREPEIYGRQTLGEIETAATTKARALGWKLKFRQTNCEGTLVDWIHEASSHALAVVLNAGAYSHTSVALLDACRALERPLVEVHLSNPFAREEFRRHSYVSAASDGLICGFGATGYLLALEAIAHLLKTQRT